EKESGLPVEKILTIWRDYLSMAKKIGEAEYVLYRFGMPISASKRMGRNKGNEYKTFLRNKFTILLYPK
ncbi:MAG: hypothetical protein ACLS5L_09605, partial [Faecalimonas sp.]